MRYRPAATALLLAAVSLAFAGCGTELSNSTTAESTQTTNGSKTTSATVDRHLYTVCQNIYAGVKSSLDENKDINFDKTLNSIATVAQNSAPDSPNSVLYEDAETVVAMEDSINGEGAPTSVYTAIDTALKKMKAHLQKYQPLAESTKS